MAWDEELKQLKRQVIGTFGENEADAAQHRVLTQYRARTIKKWPDLVDHPSDAETEMAFVREALRTEYRRLLQPH
jgi:hypothetical protein